MDWPNDQCPVLNEAMKGREYVEAKRTRTRGESFYRYIHECDCILYLASFVFQLCSLSRTGVHAIRMVSFIIMSARCESERAPLWSHFKSVESRGWPRKITRPASR